MPGGIESRIKREQLESMRLQNAQQAQQMGDPSEQLMRLAKMQAALAEGQTQSVQNQYAGRLAESEISNREALADYRKESMAMEQLRNLLGFLDLARPFGGAEDALNQVGSERFGLNAQFTAPPQPNFGLGGGKTEEQIANEKMFQEHLQLSNELKRRQLEQMRGQQGN